MKVLDLSKWSLRKLVLSAAIAAAVFVSGGSAAEDDDSAVAFNKLQEKVDPRPLRLIDDMDDGPLKKRLQSCRSDRMKPSTFSIGHRGAPLQFPEHTKESYIAAARMGAGIVECDVAFTKDRELVCRHAQNDLHSTTNIVTIPELNAKCTQPFKPADPSSGTQAKAECRTSDITLAEFKSLEGKMDAFNPNANTPEDYVGGRSELHSSRGTLLSHRESIELFKTLGVGFTPELKTPVVAMPYEGDYSQKDYARQMIQDYIEAGVDPAKVWPQSFLLDDVLFWVKELPSFGKQAVLLDLSPLAPETSSLAYMKSLKTRGVNVLAPALWKMLTLDARQEIIPSDYAKNARKAGLDLIAWTVERSGSLAGGGGWYYQTVTNAINNDGDVMTVIDVLAQDVGVIGIFSDWPATTTFYANCMGLN